MNIIKQKWIFLNTTIKYIPKQALRLYKFGFFALAARQVISLRANSRLADLNWNTAKSKIYRVTCNCKLSSVLPGLVKALNIVKEKDVVAIDFSDFGNGLQVLMFAKQSKKGRAIPVYFEILHYPIEKGSQNLFVINAIKNFEKLVGFKVKLVFDRGFACPDIIDYLTKNGFTFYIRIKQIKAVVNLKNNEKTSVKNITDDNDLRVIAYDRKLRLVISDKEKAKNNEPWYLITNDFRSFRKRVIEIYYHRFEIEEFFKDAKRLLGLEYINFQKDISLKNTLWFVILGIWFIWSIEEEIDDLSERHQMELSFIRYFLEKLNIFIIQIIEKEFIKKYAQDVF